MDTSSYPRLVTWMQCQWRYLLTYEVGEYTAPRPLLVVSDAARASIAWALQGGPDPARHYDRSWSKVWRRHDPYRLLAPEQGWLASRGAAIVRAFTAEVLPALAGAEGARPFVLTWPATTVRGQIDAVVPTPDGAPRYLLFKLGAVYDAARQATDDHLTVLALVAQAYGVAHPRLEYVFFPPCPTPRRCPDLPRWHAHALVAPAARTADQAADLRTRIIAAAAAASAAHATGRYTYSLGPHCAQCSVYWACRFARRAGTVQPQVRRPS